MDFVGAAQDEGDHGAGDRRHFKPYHDADSPLWVKRFRVLYHYSLGSEYNHDESSQS